MSATREKKRKMNLDQDLKIVEDEEEFEEQPNSPESPEAELTEPSIMLALENLADNTETICEDAKKFQARKMDKKKPEDIVKAIRTHFAKTKSMVSLVCRDKLMAVAPPEKWNEDFETVDLDGNWLPGIYNARKRQLGKIENENMELRKKVATAQGTIQILKGDLHAYRTNMEDREKFQQIAETAKTEARTAKNEVNRTQKTLTSVSQQLKNVTVSYIENIREKVNT